MGIPIVRGVFLIQNSKVNRQTLEDFFEKKVLITFRKQILRS